MGLDMMETHKHKRLNVSLVIPAYNEERYLNAVLDSVVAQSIMPDEVIVVDNNSTDDTGAIAKSYKFVKLVKEAHQGKGYASHRGFLTAKGELIARIDADTVLQPNWVETALNYFDDHHEVAAITGKCYFYDFPAKRLLSALQAFAYQDLQGLISGAPTLWGSNMVIKKTAWNDVAANQAVPAINEDIDLSLKLHRSGYLVKRLTNLVASVSLLRGQHSLRRAYHYLKPWPKTYKDNGMRIKAYFIWVLKNIVLVTSIFMIIIYRLVPRSKSD